MKLHPVRRRSNVQHTYALSIDLRALTAAADPLFQPFSQRVVIELLSPAQRALPDHQHPPSLLRQSPDIPAIARHVFGYFIQPERSSCGGNLEQIAIMMMPEAAVGKDNALIVRHDKIRAAGQRGILYGKRESGARQYPSQPFLYCRIAGAYRAHVFTAGGFIVNVGHG